jgi:fermentation-respiration switch protein FrsA (DUF1100 family)
MYSLFGSVLLIGGLAYLTILLLLFFNQSAYIYFPTRPLDQAPSDIGLTYDDLSITTSDGIQVHGWYVPARQERGVVLFCHGNGGNISHRLDTIAIFHGLGLSTLIIDYRGYGKSEGKPDEKGTYLDGEAAWNYLTTTLGKKPAEIVIFGRSLGGAVAAKIAEEKEVAGLVLESSFISVPDMAARLYPMFPVRLLCRYRYETVDSISKITRPVLIAHSPDDEIVPYEHGRKLFEAAGVYKKFLEMRGDHNSGFLVTGQEYVDGLHNFFTHVLPK